MDIATIGRQFGLTEDDTRSALEALAPVVAAGMRRSAQSPVGLQELLKSALTGTYGNTLRDNAKLASASVKVRGDELLGQILGSRAASREVPQRLSDSTGLGTAIPQEAASGSRFDLDPFADSRA